VRENHRLRQVVSDRLDFGDMIGSAPKMQSVLEVAAQAAQVDSTILLLGESGKGKEFGESDPRERATQERSVHGGQRRCHLGRTSG